jgi:hypothetical protein
MYGTCKLLLWVQMFSGVICGGIDWCYVRGRIVFQSRRRQCLSLAMQRCKVQLAGAKLFLTLQRSTVHVLSIYTL